MSVRFQYNLTGAGWAECSLQIDGAEVTVTASYLSDALDEFCRAVTEVVDGAMEATASFDEEPGEHRWRLERLPADQLRVRILEFAELWSNQADSEGQVIFDAVCGLRAFAEAVLSELERLEQTLGPEGYLEQWIEHPFPQRRLDALRGLLARPSR